MRFDIMKRMISFMLAMILLFSSVPVNAFATETESAQEPEITSSVTTRFEGKTVSILGDSISSYTGVSNNTSYNSTIGSNAVYYTAGRYDIYRADTWWQQVIDALGMELLVNNSWSGSMVVYPRQGEGSEGYKTRCVNLHNNQGREPDVILVFMGTNDFSYVNTDEFLGLYTLGTADAVDYETLIVDNGDGTYTYATPATTCEAYAIMLHKMKNRYPNAEIYCMNLMQRRDPDYADSYADAGQPAGFNAELAKIIAKYECALVDLENCGIEADSSVFDLYIGDKRVHPNGLGMDLMSEAVISAMLGQDTGIYDVSFDLTNVTGDGAHAVLPGNPYTVTLTDAEGFRNMSVTVTMGGADVTASCYADGVVSIPAVTGDVVITAESMERDPLNFRWEFDGTALSTVTSGGNAANALTKLAGSVTDGVFSSSRYQTDRTVMLLHDRPWILEWKGTGKGGVMLAADSVATTGDPFFFRRQASQMFAFGAYDGSRYNNYGITLPETIDTTLEHIYRLENRIAEDGSNMVYLYVDDAEIGALNQYFVAGTAQGTTSDWISGQDFLFNYIGTESHPLTDMSVAYLQIEEDSSVHHHSYTAVVTMPTYTQGGYTTYTCTGCGDSFIADYTDAITLYSYRWEMVDNGLESVTSDGNTANALTLNAGSVTDGTFAGARYTLENSVHLYHDVPWMMEWKAGGDWSAMLLTSTAQSATRDMTFLFRTYNTTGLLALGTYSGGSYHNYGIALADYGLDMTQEHTYRLENRIAEDGSNMVYLTVDGTELGAMNNYYIGGTDNQNQTVDWVNGRDFTFGFMGSTSHPLNNMTLEYFQVHEGGEPETLEGKTISILGDSISTYNGISNNAEYNSTIGGGAIYYPRSGFEVTAESTWWYQAAQELGLEILVNNSWSGSCLLNTRSGTVGAYVDRCVQLHDNTGEDAGRKPDIIAIFLGTNDYYTYPGTLGSYETIVFDALITQTDGEFAYAEPTTTLEAYAISLHKISQAYPDAEVYCFTLLPRLNSTSQPTAFNEDVEQLAAHFGAYVVDLHNCGIGSATDAFYMHMGDSLHPDTAGMDAITNAFVSVLLKNSGLDTHDVSFSLEDTVAMEGTTRTVVSGEGFETTLAALDASRPLGITVTMGGVDITESCRSGNTVKITSVTADVVITAEPGQREPMSFRWETKDDAFVSVTADGNAENNLTMTHGSITDGVFSKTRFTMSQGISLRHDLPWCVEWKSSGTWTDTTDGALLFAESSSSTTADACYFYRRHNNDFFAFGSCTGGKYHNYGVKFAGTGIDTTAEHVFRMENRIAEDGTNMIWLLVDGVEVGPMNAHYIGGTDQKETVDWVSGKDFSFSYMGTNPHTIGGCSLEYIQVWEAGAQEEQRELTSFRWEYDAGTDSFVNVTHSGNTENPLTMTHGTITDGTFAKTRFTLTDTVMLNHDSPWSLEWKASGTWTDTTDGALLFAEANASTTENCAYLYRRHKNTWFALGIYENGKYHNYAANISGTGIDTTEEHIYRLTNRIADDGTNMVYLYVDGVEIGPMNHHYIGGTDQNETVDWVCGKDFRFSYMGTTPHTIGGGTLDYVQVWEKGIPCDHSYTAEVTFPICTVRGYTDYTCSVCGDTYRTPWLDETAYEGMTIACVGDSITAAYGVTKDETDYVTRLAERLGMDYIRFGVSGTTLCTGGSRTCNIGKLTEASLNGADVVTIAMGINDFCAAAEGYYELGDIHSTDSSTIYGAARMWCERIVELRKTESLSHTQFYFVTPVITSWNNSVTSGRDWNQSKTNIHGYTLRDLCNAIKEVAALYDVAVIDMNLLSGMYYVDAGDNNTAEFGGDGVHPGETGHEMMAEALANMLLQNDLRDDHTHTFGSWITTTWPSCVAGEAHRVCAVCSATESGVLEPNGSHRYVAVITAPTYTEQGYTTYTCDRCGDSYVGDYTNPISPNSYRWEMQDNTMVSVTTGGNTPNALTLNSGSITDGTLSSVRGTMQSEVRLYHNLPWVIEWRSTGNWSGMLLGSTNQSPSDGLIYLFRDTSTKLFALGEYNGSWNNYGIILDCDMTVPHVFRLENRIASDGSNAVYLLVDGQEIDVMHHYYIAGTNQNQTVNWANGKDIVFSNIGTSSHPVKGMKLEYLQIWEKGHTHSYEMGICTGCGAEHPALADYKGKVISVMGDSISTFAGYIPVADGYNREHLARYPQDNLLTDVNETWWMQVVAELDAKLGINESWRGSTLSGAVPVTTGDTGENAAMSNLIRIQNMGSNGTPDVILLYGGTNDLAHVSKIGIFDPAAAPTQVDLTTAKWDNLADGFVHTLLRMRHFYPDALIVAMLPTYTASYYTDEKLAQGNAVMAQICEHYGIPYVDLRDSGVTADHLPDGIHPGKEGMDLITAAVLDLLLQQSVEPGENVVYPVTHELTHAKASLGHYKGVSAGKTFAETLDGENMTVTVTMGGVDITGECYADGRITIAEVTGALVITAEGAYSLKDHLQQLPDPYCGVNLWQVLEHDPEYYSADGWSTHSSGQVKSITFPVTPGDRLYASSFEAAGINGGSMNGIRVTYFAEDGLLVSMTAAQVYSEFSENGCLTVPEGATAISIPMWTDSDAWDVHFLCILDGHLQQIPEGSYNDTNLWPLLEHDPEYYSADGWAAHSSGNVKSVTIPVSPGDRLYASSFGAAGTNGSSMNGIRVTYFTQCGVLVSLTAAQVYEEFTEYGCLTVPEGATAVSIPMWTDSSDWELHVLTLPDRPVVTVEISWGAMEFTYTDGQWNPDTHTYAEGTWTADEDSNYITVANEGTLDATVTFVYENAEGYAFTGSFVDGETTAITGTLMLPADATRTVWLTLVGRPEEYLDYVTIGTVTVIIG